MSIFNQIKRWFNAGPSVQEQINTLHQLIMTEQEARRDAVKTVESLTSQLEQANAEVEVHREQERQNEARYASSEPWIEIKSAEYNEAKGIQIELDWNDAFIGHLKDSGITGRDDEIIVQKWLSLLYQNLSDKLEADALDRSNDPRPNDWE